MATNTPTKLAAGQLAATETDVYAFTGAGESPSIRLFNTNTTVETVKLFLYDGSTSRQCAQLDLQPLGWAIVHFEQTAFANADKIRGLTTTASKVNYWLSGILIT